MQTDFQVLKKVTVGSIHFLYGTKRELENSLHDPAFVVASKEFEFAINFLTECAEQIRQKFEAATGASMVIKEMDDKVRVLIRGE